jgi:type III secretion system (T3SS) inner membrane Yop/YscD-like protein
MASEAADVTQCEFTIVSGAHTGAKFALNDDLLLIGSQAGCDVWLSDDGVASRHAALMADERGVAIRPLEGRVSVEGRSLASSSRALVAPGCEIVLGDSGVRLRLAGETPCPNLVVHSAERTARRRLQRRPGVIAMSMLAIAGALAAGFSVQRSALPATPEPTPRVLEPAAPSDGEIIEQVRDVFRIHGYDAQITGLGDARLRIENLDPNHARVQEAAAKVRADVPALQSLAFGSPDRVKPPPEPPRYDSGREEGMSIHVEGETAYLSSAGGARYFVGSVLPGGYEVRRITSSAIEVDREGQISWFSL